MCMKKRRFIYVYLEFTIDEKDRVSLVDISFRGIPFREYNSSLGAYYVSILSRFYEGDKMFFTDENRFPIGMFEIENNEKVSFVMTRFGTNVTNIPSLGLSFSDIYGSAKEILRKNGIRVYKSWKFYGKEL